MPIRPFWVRRPKCSKILSISQKAHFGWKHAFWRIDRPDRSEMRPGRAVKKARKKEKNWIEIQLFNKSRYVFFQTTHVELCFTKGVPAVVNHAKFSQHWLRGFGFLGSRNLSFSYAWRYGLCKRLGLLSNLWSRSLKSILRFIHDSYKKLGFHRDCESRRSLHYSRLF